MLDESSRVTTCVDVESSLARGDHQSAGKQLLAFLELGGEVSDEEWCRWVLWDRSNLVTVTKDPATGRITVSTSGILTAWSVEWLPFLEAVENPSPILLALKALLASSRQELPTNKALVDHVAACADTSWLHYLVGTAYRYCRAWEAAESHLRQAQGDPGLTTSAHYELMLVLAQSGQVYKVGPFYREWYAKDKLKFHHICVNVVSSMHNSSDYSKLYEFAVLVEELMQAYLWNADQPIAFRYFSSLFHSRVNVQLMDGEGKVYDDSLRSSIIGKIEHWEERAPQASDVPARIGYFFGMGGGPYVFPPLSFVRRSAYRTFFYFHNVPEGADPAPDDSDACDVFRPMGGMNDDAMVAAIKADDLDLLIVLDAIGLRARDVVLRRRPARRIVYYGNVFGPTATPIVDALLLPESMASCFDGASIAEAIIRFPDWVNLVSTVRGRFFEPLPPQPPGVPVIGAAANGMKLNVEWFLLVARIMEAVPEATLRLDVPTICWAEFVRIHDDARAAGIDWSRTILNNAEFGDGFRERLEPLSLAIDSFPMSCYFSAIQTLSAGVPILTFPGAIPSGRGTTTVLNAAGIPGLVCSDERELEAKAIALLRHPDVLADLRRMLPVRMRESMFNDFRGVARAWEGVLDQALALPVRDLRRAIGC